VLLQYIITGAELFLNQVVEVLCPYNNNSIPIMDTPEVGLRKSRSKQPYLYQKAKKKGSSGKKLEFLLKNVTKLFKYS